MGLWKSIKTVIRKSIHLFGYDLVPLRKARVRASPRPVRRPKLRANIGDLLKPYIDWFGEEAVRERRFYNLGAEPQFKHPAWTVINHPSMHYGEDYMDIKWDLMSGEPLPIESGKARVIFSRYTLEHALDDAVQHFLEEAYRALAKGAFLRLITPDIDLYYAAYQMKDDQFFFRQEQDKETFPNEKFLANPNLASFEQRFLWNFASSASELHPDPAAKRISDQEFQKVFQRTEFKEAMDFCTSRASVDIQKRYPDNHINWFNAEKMEEMISLAGFQIAYRSGYGQSRCPVLRDTGLLEDRQPELGLFFEAIR